MNEEKLKSIETNIKKKKCSRTTIMEDIGNTAIEDIRAFVEKEKRMPEVKEIVDEYRKLLNFDNILMLVDITPIQIEKFVGILLKEGEMADFQVAEV